MKARIIKAFSQESTWRGLIAIAMAGGITIEPDLQNHIIAIGLTMIGIINVSKND